MAKRPIPNQPQGNDSSEMKKLMQQLYAAVQVMNSNAKESTKINREMLKTLALLNAGFAQNENDARKLIDEVKEGLELTDEYAKKWAKERGATDKDIKKLIDQFRDLEDLQEDQIDNAQDYLDLLENHNKLYDEGIDLSRKLLDNHENLAKAIRESKNVAQKLGGATGNIDSILSNIVKKKVDFSSMFSDVLPSLDNADELIGKIKEDIDGLVNNLSGTEFEVPLHFSPNTKELDQEVGKILEGINQERDLRISALEDFFARNRKLQTQLSRQYASDFGKLDIKVDVDTGQLMTSTGILKKGMDGYEEMIKNLDSIAQENNFTEKLKEDFQEITELIRLGTQRTETQSDRLQEMLKPLDLASKLLVEEFEIRQSDLEGLKESVVQERNRFKALSAYSGQLASAEKMVMKIGAGFDYINSVLPSGVGDFLGLSDVSSKLLEGHKKGVQAFSQALGEGATQSEAIAGYMGSFGPVLKMAINPLTAIVAGVLLLKELVEGIVEKYKQMEQEMKISLIQSKELMVTQLDILTSQKNQFATMQDIMDVQGSMIKSLGKVSGLNDKSQKDLAINLIDISKAFGYSIDNAVELHRTFQRLGADDELAKNLQTNLGLMSEMAGLSPQLISQDLLDAADEVSTYFAGYPEKAAKAAIEVRRLGFSLKQAGSIAQETLNLEGFMTNMYELMSMSGGKIDFSGVFEKGLMGDIEGMTKDIMDQIGTTAEYNKMDYLTRVKISKTLGMSVDELSKSVMLHEKMGGLSKEEQEALQGNLDRMGDISKMSKDDIKNRLQQLESTDRLGVAWDKIKGVLFKALLPLAEAFAEAIDALMPILDLVIMAFKSILYIVKPLMPLIKFIMIPLKAIGMILESITEKLDSVGGNLGEIGKIATSIGTIFGTWFIGKKLLGGFGSIKDSIGGITQSIPGIGTMFSGVFGKAKNDATQSTAQITTSAQTATEQITQTATQAAKTISTVGNESQAKVAEVGKQIQNIPVGNLAKTSTEVTTKVNKDLDSVATKTEEVVQKTNKSSSGFMKGLTKGGFKLVTKASAVTFSLMAADMVRGFMQGEKAGESSMDTLKEHGMSMFGGLAVSGAGMLSSYLEEGVAKAFEKLTTKHLEEKFEPGMKKIQKGLQNLGPTAAKGLDPVKKILGSAGDIISKKFKMKGLLGKIFGGGDEVLDQVDTIQSTVQDTSQTVQDVVEKVKKTNVVEDTTKNIAEKTVQLPTKPEEILPEKQKAIPSPKSTKQILPDLSTQEKDIKEKSSSIRKMVTDGFSGLETIVKKAWSGLKTVILDISKLISGVLKNVSQGLGQAIKNILKGVGDGLSSFKTSALKGAATLLVLSGALWVTSKALQNFAQVKWEDIGKAGASLAGLAAVALVLGSASAQMIIGAVAIGLLGASLIPAAYALQMFEDIKWESIGKAAVTLVALGVAGAALGSFAPLMLLGAVSIAALGASLIPAAFALNMFNDVDWSAIGKGIVALLGFGAVAALFGTLTPLLLLGSLAITGISVSVGIFAGSLMLLSIGLESIKKPLDGMAISVSNVAKSIKDLISLPFQNLFGIAGGLTAIAASLSALTLVETGTGLLNSFNKLFGNDLVTKLDDVAQRADKIQIVADSIQGLVAGLLDLSQILSNLDFSNLDSLSEIKKIGVNQTDELLSKQPQIEQDNTRTSEGLKVRQPFEKQNLTPEPPKKESVAQDLRIAAQDLKVKTQAARNESRPGDSYRDEQGFDPTQPNFKNMEMMFRRMVQLLEFIAQKNPDIILDGQKVNASTKKFNNNKG